MRPHSLPAAARAPRPIQALIPWLQRLPGTTRLITLSLQTFGWTFRRRCKSAPRGPSPRMALASLPWKSPCPPPGCLRILPSSSCPAPCPGPLPSRASPRPPHPSAGVPFTAPLSGSDSVCGRVRNPLACSSPAAPAGSTRKGPCQPALPRPLPPPNHISLSTRPACLSLRQWLLVAVASDKERGHPTPHLSPSRFQLPTRPCLPLGPPA